MGKRLLFLVPAISLLILAGIWNPPVSLSSYDSTQWIESGLERERSGDLTGAERDLLQAARVDRLFQPRWTLAGFYFRHEKQEQFWLWTRKALDVGQRDLGALFDLCWKTSSDPREIWSRAMPERKATWVEYLFYLTVTGRWPAASATALKIAAVADSGDKTPLVNYCDSAIEHLDREGASTVWRALCRRRLLPFDPDRLLNNGDFRAEPAGRGFDWRVTDSLGISSSFRTGEETFSLSGFQPERAVLIRQWLALSVEHSYRLRFEYKTVKLTAGSGVHWEAGPNKGPGLSGAGWMQGEFDFTGGADALALVYQRQSGATAAEGLISIRNLEVIPR